MAIPKEIPSYELLAKMFEIFEGILYWKERPREMFKTDGAYKRFNKIFKGKACGQNLTKSSRYLVVRCGEYGHIKQHRIFASLYAKRDIKTSEIVDHLDGITTNNSEDNIRIVGYTENSRNQKLWENSSTGVKGVTKLINPDLSVYYRAQWHEDGKRKSKAFSFSKYGEEEAFSLACKARTEAIERIGGYIERD